MKYNEHAVISMIPVQGDWTLAGGYAMHRMVAFIVFSEIRALGWQQAVTYAWTATAWRGLRFCRRLLASARKHCGVELLQGPFTAPARSMLAAVGAEHIGDDTYRNPVADAELAAQ